MMPSADIPWAMRSGAGAASLQHMTKPCEWNDTTPRQHSVFENPPKPGDGLFQLPTGPGLGLQINEAELAKRRVPIA